MIWKWKVNLFGTADEYNTLKAVIPPCSQYIILSIPGLRTRLALLRVPTATHRMLDNVQMHNAGQIRKLFLSGRENYAEI